MPERNKRKSGRLLRIGVFLAAAGTLLSGCMKSAGLPDGPVAYNITQEQVHSCGPYTVTFDDLAESFKRTDTVTGETVDLTRSPFRSQEDFCGSFFALGGSVYLLQNVTPQEEHHRFGSVVERNTVSLIELDVATLRERTVFETVFRFDNSEDARHSPWEFLVEIDSVCFFLNDRSLFVLAGFTGEETIRQIDFATHGITRLPIPITASNIAFDGRSIYYLDEDSLLFTYDTETGEAAAVAEIAARDFFLTEDRIYYLDRRDRDTLHAYELETGTAWKLADLPAGSVWLEGEGVCFWAREEGVYYWINPDGTGLRAAGEMPK